MEIKRPGKRPRGAQQYILEKLTQRGIPCCWCDNAEAGIEWLKKKDRKDEHN